MQQQSKQETSKNNFKFYLPAFDLTVTVPSLKAAGHLQQALLELLQYRGIAVSLLDDIEKDESVSSSLKVFSKFKSIVGVATKQQVLTTLLVKCNVERDELATFVENQHGDNEDIDDCFEQWELDYCKASTLFCQFKFQECNVACVKNLQKTPSDIFSFRLLFISSYFSSECQTFAAECLKLADHFRKIMQQNNEMHELCLIKTEIDEHPASATVVAVTLQYVLAYASYAVNESLPACPSTYTIEQSLSLAHESLALTRALNNKLDHEEAASAQRCAAIKPWYRDKSSIAVANYFTSSIHNSALMPEPKTLVPTENTVADGPRFHFANAFAVHAVCHVFETMCDPKSGIAWVTDKENEDLWLPAIYLAPHVWWHLALFHYADGNVAAALDIYEKHISNLVLESPDAFSLADATALIVRIELLDDILTSMDDGKNLLRLVNNNNAAPSRSDALTKVTKSAGEAIQKVWNNQFGGDTKYEDVENIPFFHAHKCLMNMVSQRTHLGGKQSTKNNEGASRSVSSSPLLFIQRMNQLARNNNNGFEDEDEEAKTFILESVSSFVDLEQCNNDASIDIAKILAMASQVMGGSIAQKHMLYFVWLWLMVKLKKTLKIDECDINNKFLQKLLDETEKKCFGDAKKIGEKSFLIKTFAELFSTN